MTIKTLALIALLTGVAACGQKTDTAPAAAESSGPVAPGTMVKGKGTVTAIDAANGSVTLDHESIPAAGWPAMTMSFKAPATVIAGAKPGQLVTFDLRIEPKGGEIVAMQAQ